MKKLIVFLVILLGGLSLAISQQQSSCESTTAFPKGSTPDLGIVIYSSDAETVWNAMRLANYCQSKGDTVVVFVLGKGLDAFNASKNEAFDLEAQNIKFLSGGGQILSCGTCAKLRNTDEVKLCTITGMADLYEIIKRSRKVVSF
jgi:uncharacterized protein involved in oxidation of intracellular sulfur